MQKECDHICINTVSSDSRVSPVARGGAEMSETRQFDPSLPSRRQQNHSGQKHTHNGSLMPLRDLIKDAQTLTGPGVCVSASSSDI